MKIVNKESGTRTKTVGSRTYGDVVQFNKRFYQDYPPNDLYIVLNVCGSYTDKTHSGFASNKTGIANLASGRLSFVSPDREVTVMNAEVNVDGPRD